VNPTFRGVPFGRRSPLQGVLFPRRITLLANEQYPEAIAQARLAMGEWPLESGWNSEVPWLVLIAAESENGQTAEALADLQKFLATQRTYRSIAEVEQLRFLRANSKLLEGLRHAGMPEE